MKMTVIGSEVTMTVSISSKMTVVELMKVTAIAMPSR